MSKVQQIRLIRNQEIDYNKWDECINKSLSGKLYARSWFLDLVAEGWEALVYEDYKFIMPLPVKSKWGIRYVSQPAYCQQAGIYPTPDIEIQKQFAAQLKQEFRLINYQINVENDVVAFEGFQKTEKINYILHLNNSYENIFSNYLKHTKRNLKSCQRFNVSVIKGLLHHEYLKEKELIAGPSYKKSEYTVLNRLMAQSIAKGKGVIYAAFTGENNLCAAAFYVFDGDRIYYLNSFSNEQGKKNMATYAIMDHVINEYSENDLILDFEGSVIESIAWFFRSFGPLAEKYFYIYSNRLPVVRMFMK
ncbi:MAG: hypothetical protein HQ541_23290 [Mariniphaga sp.]|nr:hypothetical protein [Mariniphaga sp.]